MRGISSYICWLFAFFVVLVTYYDYGKKRDRALRRRFIQSRAYKQNFTNLRKGCGMRGPKVTSLQMTVTHQWTIVSQ